LAGVTQVGVVQAGVIGGIAEQRHQRSGCRQHQRQAGAAHRQHAHQSVQGALGVGQGVAHRAALGAGVIDPTDHPGLRHAKSAR